MSDHAQLQRRDFEPGDRVLSKTVGLRVSFEGVIVEKACGGWNVRDAEGRLWLRNRMELKPI